MQLFDLNRPRFKGNTHTHSTVSDGRLAPEAVMEIYRAAGYDFLTLTDHRKQNAETEYRGMKVYSGTELDYSFDNQVVHMTAFAMNAPLDTEKACLSPEDGIAAITAAGGLTILAHPYWSLNTPDMLKRLDGICAMEIYNTQSGSPWNADRADSAAFCDLAFTNGYLTGLIAADDAHYYAGEDCKSYIVVNADANTREALQEAILAGRYYASRGPEFKQVTIEGRTVRVECSPADKVIFYSNAVWTRERTIAGDGLTDVVHECQNNEEWLRIEIVDKNGMKAYTNPVRLPVE